MIKSVQNDVTLQIPDVTLYSTVWLLVGFFCFMCECEWIIFCCWTFSSPSNWFMKWLFISWPNLSFYLSLCLPGCLCACWQKQLLPKQQLASCGWKKNNKEQDNSKPDSSLNPVCSAPPVCEILQTETLMLILLVWETVIGFTVNLLLGIFASKVN